jgi:hypothetical protein
VDLLKVVTANAAGNFVLTIDEASTSLPRQTLDEIMHNMMQNSYVLIGSVTPMSPVSWEYIKYTPRNVVTTMTAMQLHRQKGFSLEPGPQSGFGHYQAQEIRTVAWLKSTTIF